MKARIPSLRLHKPSGRAVVTLSGKDHYCGPFGSPAAQQEYQRLLGEWLASGGTPPAAARSGITVAEMLVPYLKFTDDYYRPPSQEAGKIRRRRRGRFGEPCDRSPSDMATHSRKTSGR